MKKLICFLLICCCYGSFSQNVSSLNNDDNEINKLLKEISATNNDSIKSINHLRISGLYFKNEKIKEYQFHLQKGKQLSKKNAFLQTYAKYNTALNHLYNNDYDSLYLEISEVLKELKQFKNSTSTELQLLIVQNISIYHTINLDYDLSIQILIEEGIPLAKRTHNYTALGANYESIADSFFELGDYRKSAGYYKLAIRNYKKEIHKSIDLLSVCYIYYSNCLAQLGDYSESGRILSEANKILKKYHGNNLYPLYYNALGELNFKLKKYAEAISNFNSGIKIIESNNNAGINDATYLSLILNLAASKYEIKNYKGSLAVLENLNLNTNDSNELAANELLYKNFDKLGNYEKAYHYLKGYSSLKDSLDDVSKGKEYRMLEARYNVSEKQKEIFRLENEKTEKEIRLQNLRLYYMLGFTVLIIVIILFIFLYKNFKNQKKLNQQQEVIHKQNIIFLESRKEVELMQAMMEGEESERKRIARDLHDGVASRLSSLQMQLEQLNSNEHGHLEYQKISSNLALAIKDLRQTAFNLIPETLSELGLDMALKDLCFLMSNATVNIHYNSNQISNDIISSQQTTIFRIVQELINNALKHADCTEVIVDCSQNNTLFLITVEDNGTGFDTKNLDNYKGLGLKNIKNRVDLLDGNMDAKYIAGVGTIFNIEVKVRF